jgi:hypothetical protein
MNRHSQYSDFNSATISNSKIQIPLLHARDLNGSTWIIPDDLPAQKTLLLVAFKRQQQNSINSWIHGLALRSAENRIAWIEVPLLQKPWKLLESWIDQGMRRGITDCNLRGHVWTVYTNRSSFLKTIGVTSTHAIYALVVHQNGTIIASVTGDYCTNNAAIILKALRD